MPKSYRINRIAAPKSPVTPQREGGELIEEAPPVGVLVALDVDAAVPVAVGDPEELAVEVLDAFVANGDITYQECSALSTETVTKDFK